MTGEILARRRQRARAARLAPTLCEAELFARPRLSPVIARSALLAAGLPPHLAARLRGQLRLVAEQEAKP